LQQIKINLFGIGCRVIKGEFEEGIWKRFHATARAIKTPLDEAIFDTSFYESLKMEEYKSLADLGNVFQYNGLMNDAKSLIEIRINNRKKRNIRTNELFNESVLFPVFRTTVCKVENAPLLPNSLLAVEKEMGTITSYKFETGNFSLDKLSFAITTLNINKPGDCVLLTKIEYDGMVLTATPSDTLVTERYCYLG